MKKPTYEIGQKVYFRFGDKTYHGTIEIIDIGGAIGCNETSYDIYVASINTLCKHVEERYILTSIPNHIDNIMERDYRKMIRYFKIGTFQKEKYITYEHNGNTTKCIYVFSIDMSLLANGMYKFDSSYINNIAKMFNAVSVENDSLILFTIYGKSLCNPSDTFDKMLGEKIARIKAKQTAYNIIFSIMCKIHQDMFRISNKITSTKLEIDAMINAQQNYLKRICHK